MNKLQLPTYSHAIKGWIEPAIGKRTFNTNKKAPQPLDPSQFPFAFIFVNLQDYQYFDELQTRKSERQSILIPKEEHAKVLEYLIFLSQRHFKNEKAVSFFHSFDKIAEKTGVSRSTVIRIIKRFEEKLKIIHTSIAGGRLNYKTIYQINYTRLTKLLPAIYLDYFDEDNKSDHAIRYHQRKAHFEYMAEQFNNILSLKKLPISKEEEEEYNYNFHNY